ncbi:3-hydroxyacyl-ACP dehydratase FabZ [Rhodovulum sulfidophilum]|uniref:3-hydroxyacyl-ACP dehydratase FabZ n=1 Tax=Rhodovulum sulfidophilum TaxID=35806 RepID=UPI0009519F22|nr:3-hydroxyacyl-ACP dehydratase FabZ [Rhodovulum sulfidophilum]MBL3550736.1 3-hydroxyacyl-ACP dehydratase FabZ [Rhodovulum sulfidophilum]OLS48594.1 3-hydroxyacyl-[acyl-carrier-protein] dehydratase FabZ [Rhodovulum sulfidophilum]
MSDAQAPDADIDEIQKILPHRYPFLMVDRVTQIIPGQSAVGIKNVSINEPHFQGHFPSKPIMPGVLIVEAMGQTGGVLVGRSVDLADDDLLVYFMGMDKCKFRRMVVPGDVLELHVKVRRGGSKKVKIWKFEGVAKVGDEIAAEAEFTAMMDINPE